MYSENFMDLAPSLTNESSLRGAVEFSDEENAEINRSFSNLQVSFREPTLTYNSMKLTEEINQNEHNFKKLLTKMGLV